MRRVIAIVVVWLGMTVLSACGGGGGGGATPSTVQAPSSAPTVTVGYQAKQVILVWDAVNGATYYRVLKNPDGVSGYNAIASNVTATGYTDNIAVHLTDWVNVSYEVEACNSGGCTAAAVAAADSIKTIGYVKAFNTGADDQFGQSVAISGDGNTMAVGAPDERSSATGIDGDINSNAASYAGAVYIYGRDAGTGLWSRQAYVKASNSEASDYFGYSVSLSSDGNTMAVSAYYESSSATGVNGSQNNNSASASGAVYVFTRTTGSWSQQAYLKSSNTGTNDTFGDSVALSGDGNTLAVGATGEDGSATGIGGSANDSASGSGAVYVFTRSGTNWTQQAYVKASNTQVNDRFGFSVSLSGTGDTLAVGAIDEDSNATGVDGDQSNNGASSSGAVYVFHRASGFWSQQAYVKASNTGQGDNFGFSVSLSSDGNALAVGACGESSDATGVNGDQTNDIAAFSGAVYLFTRSGAAWSQQAYVKASNTGVWDLFGNSVSLSGDGGTLAVGAYQEQSAATGINGDQTDDSLSYAGAVYVFTRSGSAWSQKSYVKALNTGDSDNFGWAISLSSDGGTLAVGAYGEGSAATGVGGDQADNSAAYAGAVYVY